jgi:hypothetical protein
MKVVGGEKCFRFNVSLDHFRLVVISGILLGLDKKNGSMMFARK